MNHPYRMLPENRLPVVLATGNPEKVRELRPMMESVSPIFSILSLPDLGITSDIEETETTLEGNAFLKADAIFELVEPLCHFCIVMADDTGLEVDALGGEPGVYSARFAPETKQKKPTYEDNVRHLLLRMEGINERSARFRTVIAMKGRIPSKNAAHEFRHKATGVVEGSITRKPVGTLGFGYDPIFRVQGDEKTYAEMTIDEKNIISHRAQALSCALTQLSAIMANHYSPAT